MSEFNTNDAKEIVRQFIIKDKSNKDLNYEDDLFAAGFVDSLFALQLVLFLEKEFEIKVANKHITENNFRSVNNIVATVVELKDQ